MTLSRFGFALLAVAVWTGATSADDAQDMTAEQQQAVKTLESLGGRVMPIAQNDDRLDVTLHLTDKDVTDEHLALIAKLPKVAWVNLTGTKITNDGLKHLAGLATLEKLHLKDTGVSDPGLAHLTGLNSLVYLNLYATQVSDAGLKHLRRLKNLRSVYVAQTKVTPEGMLRLQAATSPLKVVGNLELKPVEPPKEEKKEEPKKEPAKKEPAKKEPAKKAEPKKEQPKKAEPKKAEPKKAEPKKAPRRRRPRKRTRRSGNTSDKDLYLPAPRQPDSERACHESIRSRPCLPRDVAVESGAGRGHAAERRLDRLRGRLAAHRLLR